MHYEKTGSGNEGLTFSPAAQAGRSNPVTIQRKLSVGAVNDRQEHEADAMADHVMRMPEPNLIQRKCAHCEEEEAQRKPLTSFIQKKEEGGKSTVSDAVHHQVQATKGGGNALPHSTKTFMESRFGTDFSGVRIHSGGYASQMSAELNAQAFTVGNDIYFNSGKFSPESSAGKHLLAHELTHTVQQASSGSSAVANLQRTIGDGHDLQSPRFAGDPVLEACFDNETLLRSGSRGPAVEKLQQALIDAGFPLPRFGVDGIFGSETAGAVRDYQRARGLVPDALVGPLTMGRLDAEFAAPGPPPPAPPAPPGPAPAPPGPAPAPPGPAPAPPGPAPAPPGPAPAPPGPAPAPPGPAPAPPGPAPAPPGPAPAPPAETITSQTVVTAPAPRTRTKIGVGEEVTLTHTPGAAAWSVPAGLGTFSVANGPVTIYTAPDTAQARVTVTGGAATIDFEIVAPTSVAMDREPGTGVMHARNRPTSGVRTRVFLGPDTVNFNKVIYREMDVNGVASAGVYSCNPFSTGHCNAGGGGVPCPDKDMLTTVLAGKGTQSRLGDCATSGDCCSTPLAAGNVSLSIPYQYKVGAGAFRQFTIVPQVHALAADLTTLTTDKAGEHGQTTIASPTVTVAGCTLNSCP